MTPMLSPSQRQTLLWALVGALLLWALLWLGPVLTPFVTAGILAYVLQPAVRAMVRRRVPRVVAAIIAILGAVLAITLTVLIFVPIVRQEYLQVRAQLPGLVAQATGNWIPRIERLIGVELPVDADAIRDWLSMRVSESGEQIARAAFGWLQVGGSAVAQVLGLLFLVPVVLFFMLLDWDRLLSRTGELVPPRWRAPFFGFTGEIDGLLAQFLRGQMLVMGSLAIYYSVSLLLAGYQLWLPLGVLTGVLTFVPYAGFATGLVLATISGVLQFGPVYGFGSIALIYGVGQAIESYWLTPRLVGERIGLPPLAVILALLAFGALLGFVGVLLALPLAAALAVGLRRLRGAYLASEFYRRP